MKAVVFGLSGTVLHQEAGEYHLRTGAAELLPILNRLGLKVVAYAPNDHKAAAHLRASGDDRHFHAIVADRHDGTSRIAGLESLLSDMRVRPSETVVVGHSVADVWLGRDINSAKVVAVADTSQTGSTLRAAGADHVIADIPSLLDVLES